MPLFCVIVSSYVDALSIALTTFRVHIYLLFLYFLPHTSQLFLVKALVIACRCSLNLFSLLSKSIIAAFSSVCDADRMSNL